MYCFNYAMYITVKQTICRRKKMENGTVKWFNPRRGYGFLTGEDEIDYFVHHSNIEMEGFRTLKEGQSVTFEIGEDNDKRNIAVQVKVIE